LENAKLNVTDMIHSFNFGDRIRASRDSLSRRELHEIITELWTETIHPQLGHCYTFDPKAISWLGDKLPLLVQEEIISLEIYFSVPDRKVDFYLVPS
jgi:hypothetical protein